MPPDGALSRDSSPTIGSAPCTCRASFLRPSPRPLHECNRVGCLASYSPRLLSIDKCFATLSQFLYGCSLANQAADCSPTLLLTSCSRRWGRHAVQAMSMLPARKGVRQGWTIKTPTCARRATCELGRQVSAHTGHSSPAVAACSSQCPVFKVTQWQRRKTVQCSEPGPVYRDVLSLRAFYCKLATSTWMKTGV